MDEQAKNELARQWKHLFRKDGDKAQQAKALRLWAEKPPTLELMRDVLAAVNYVPPLSTESGAEEYETIMAGEKAWASIRKNSGL